MPKAVVTDSYSIGKTAALLGVNVKTARKWAVEGHLIGYKTPSGRWRFTDEAVDAFIAKRTHKPEAIQEAAG